MRLRQVGVALVAPSMVLALWAGIVLVPNMSAERDVNERLDATEQQLVALTGVFEQSNGLTERIDELQEQSVRLDRAVPATVDTVGVVRLLHDLGIEHGVAVTSVSPTINTGDSDLDSSGTSTLTVSLEGSYSGTMGFIDGLLVAERLIRIDRLDLSADATTGTLFVDLTVSTFSRESSTTTEVASLGSDALTGGASLEADT